MDKQDYSYDHERFCVCFLQCYCMWSFGGKGRSSDQLEVIFFPPLDFLFSCSYCVIKKEIITYQHWYFIWKYICLVRAGTYYGASKLKKWGILRLWKLQQCWQCFVVLKLGQPSALCCNPISLGYMAAAGLAWDFSLFEKFCLILHHLPLLECLISSAVYLSSKHQGKSHHDW